MIALQVKNVKDFMNKLLTTDCFDSFLLEEASIMNYNYFSIDGHINQEFYGGLETTEDEKPAYEFSRWADMRSVVFQLIKGKRTPLQMKFVLQLKPDAFAAILSKGDTNVSAEDIRGMILTIRFDQSGLRLITATSFKTFIMDKTPDQLWDQELKKFLRRKEIDFDDISE